MSNHFSDLSRRECRKSRFRSSVFESRRFRPRALPKRSCVCYTCAMEKVAIVGGGAGGLFCAARLLQKGIKPVILEAGVRVGKKILVSGNGRCNLSNKNVSAERYNAPDFVAPVLQKYAVEEVMRVWRGMGLVCRSDAEGRIFPYSNHSGSVLNVLLRATRGARIMTDAPVTAITREKDGFTLEYRGGKLRAEKVVLACGSRAGGGRESYFLAEKLGHGITPLKSAITYLKTNAFKGLKGVRARARASLEAGGKIFSDEGEILFRDDGVSGILAFWLSSFAARENSGGVLRLDFAPDLSKNELEEIYGGREQLLCGLLQKALADKLIAAGGLSCVKSFKTDVVLAEGEGQVVCGGLKLDGFEEQTLSSRLHEGLYCIGEMLDVDGECGGYNLHWACAGALAAADDIAKSKK